MNWTTYVQVVLLGTICLSRVCGAGGRRGGTRGARGRKQTGLAAQTSNLEWCPPCDITHCPVVLESTCGGNIVLDMCNCCPICLSGDQQAGPGDIVGRPDIEEQPSAQDLAYQQANQSEACAKITCPKFQVCMLNIQGLPMCRCPTKFWCMKGDRSPVCANNVTYKSKCFLKMTECESGRNIPLDHKGKCLKSQKDRDMKMERQRLKEQKMQEREERRQKKAEKKVKRRQKKIKQKKRDKKRQQRGRKQKRWARSQGKLSRQFAGLIL